MKLRSGLTYSSLHTEINSLSNTVITKTKACSKKNHMKKTTPKQKTAISNANKSIKPVIDIDKQLAAMSEDERNLREMLRMDIINAAQSQMEEGVDSFSSKPARLILGTMNIIGDAMNPIEFEPNVSCLFLLICLGRRRCRDRGHPIVVLTCAVAMTLRVSKGGRP